MADTFGGLIDKLITVDMKMWNNQEFLYEVRRIPFEEFQEKYTDSEDKQKALFESIKKCCDLNFQRNVLIDEIDEMLVTVLEAVGAEGVDIEKLIQRKHKTY
jgi:hypothetical protein|tara:strand:+ start:279 stop:584 length:306 start_codon:yes stop_codon:yes gene_type:complete